MKIVRKIMDKINRVTKIYEGTVYEVKDESKKILTKKNIENNTNVVIEKIYYKRPFFTNMYVKEISTGKKIPTFIKKKKMRMPFKKFVIVDNCGYKFDEIEINKNDIDPNYNVTNEINEVFGKKSTTLEIPKFSNLTSKVKKIASDSKFDYKKPLKFFKKKKETKNIDKIVIEEKPDDVINDCNEIEVEKLYETENNIIEENGTKENDEKPEEIEIIHSEVEDENKIVLETNNKTEVLDKPKIKEEIKQLKQIKREILCDYWMTKEYPRKNTLKLDAENKDIEKIADEMINNINNENIVKTNFNGVFLTTQILKTKKEIIAYYQYKTDESKKTLDDDIKENCYKMIRADRKIKK